MDDSVLRQVAQLQYRQSLLIKALRNRGVLQVTEPDNLYSEAEFTEFLRDFLEVLRRGDV